MSKLLFSILCLLLSFNNAIVGQGTYVSLKGKVVDQDNRPLSLVNIIIKGTGIGTTTNYEGEFTLPQVQEKSIVVIFSSIGYEVVEREILHPH